MAKSNQRVQTTRVLCLRIEKLKISPDARWHWWDREIRIKTAKMLAEGRSRLATVEVARLRLVAKIEEKKRLERDELGPAIGRLASGKELPNPNGRARWKALKDSTRQVCKVCPTSEELGVAEPAWAILSHGAQDTCDLCGLRELRTYCDNCPLVQFLQHPAGSFLSLLGRGQLLGYNELTGLL